MEEFGEKTKSGIQATFYSSSQDGATQACVFSNSLLKNDSHPRRHLECL